jgi:outer membrane lipoprotein-sorting protein
VILSHHMQLAVRFTLAVLLSSPVIAQSRPDAAEILKRVGQTYIAVKQYQLESEGTERSGGTAPSHMTLAVKPPNKYRMEGTVLLSGDASDFGDTVIICDGSLVWFYVRKTNQYASFPLSEVTTDAPGDLGDLRPEEIDLFVMDRFRHAADFIEGAKYLREEAVDLAGKKVDCYVVAIPEKREIPASTWWVAKSSYHVVRNDDAESSTVFTTIKLNQPLPDELFTFKPPPAAGKLEMHR